MTVRTEPQWRIALQQLRSAEATPLSPKQLERIEMARITAVRIGDRVIEPTPKRRGALATDLLKGLRGSGRRGMKMSAQGADTVKAMQSMVEASDAGLGGAQLGNFLGVAAASAMRSRDAFAFWALSNWIDACGRLGGFMAEHYRPAERSRGSRLSAGNAKDLPPSVFEHAVLAMADGTMRVAIQEITRLGDSGKFDSKVGRAFAKIVVYLSEQQGLIADQQSALERALAGDPSGKTAGTIAQRLKAEIDRFQGVLEKLRPGVGELEIVSMGRALGSEQTLFTFDAPNLNAMAHRSTFPIHFYEGPPSEGAIQAIRECARSMGLAIQFDIDQPRGLLVQVGGDVDRKRILDFRRSVEELGYRSEGRTRSFSGHGDLSSPSASAFQVRDPIDGSFASFTTQFFTSVATGLLADPVRQLAERHGIELHLRCTTGTDARHLIDAFADDAAALRGFQRDLRKLVREHDGEFSGDTNIVSSGPRGETFAERVLVYFHDGNAQRKGSDLLSELGERFDLSRFRIHGYGGGDQPYAHVIFDARSQGDQEAIREAVSKIARENFGAIRPC
jgi:hypothetical protein